MKGIVDDSGRAILPVEILCTKHPTGVQVDVWIDTGFTGDLVLPESLVEDLELEVTGAIDLSLPVELVWPSQRFGSDCELRSNASAWRRATAGKGITRRLHKSRVEFRTEAQANT
jgi:hypothetical protein